MTHLLTHLLWLAAAGGGVWLPGWCLERACFAAPRSHGVRFFVRWLLGFAWWTALLLVLAATGLFRPAPLIAISVTTLLGWSLLGLRLRILDGRIRSTHAFSPADADEPSALVRSASTTLLVGALSILALGPLFCIAINPTVSWDADVYHLTLPKLYLEHGGFRDVEMSVYSHFPHSTELFFGVAMAARDHVLAKVLHFGFGVLVMAGLVCWIGGSAGFLAAALFLLNGVVLLELKIAYIDLAHAFFLLAGCALASRVADGSDGESASRGFFLTGLAAGLLAGVKVTGIVSAATLALLLAPRWLRELSLFGRRRAAISMLSFLAPVAALWSPWLIKSWWWTGNPVYPFAYRIFGGPDWSVELGRQLSDWQRGIGMGREPLDYLLLPFRAVLQGGEGYGRFDGEIAWFWLLSAPLILLAMRSPGPGRRLAFVSSLHAVWWAMSSQQMRFLIPVLALLAATTAMTAERLVSRWRRSSRRLLVAVLMISLSTTAAVSHSAIWSSGWRHFQLYLRPGFEPLAESPRPAIYDAVAQLPEDSRLLMLNTNRGFFVPREYLADSFFEASQISYWLAPAKSTADVAQKLVDREIDYLLLDRRPLGVPYPQPLLDLLADPRWVKPVADEGRFLLLKVHHSP